MRKITFGTLESAEFELLRNDGLLKLSLCLLLADRRRKDGASV